MQVLREWAITNEGATEQSERVKAVREIIDAVECHVVRDRDGYSLGSHSHYSSESDHPPNSSLEIEALKEARRGYALQQKEMQEFAKSLDLARKPRKRFKSGPSDVSDDESKSPV